MQSFLINLDRSPDRLHFFESQAAASGISFTRVSGVDGRELTQQELDDAVAPSYEFQPINAGEIGLFMSHKRAWERLIESGDPHAAVFEDDAVLSKSIRAIFDAIDSQRPEFDVIKLETTLRAVVCQHGVQPLSTGNTLQRLATWHGGTAGYVISRSCAEKLLDWKSLLADPIDQVMFNPMSRVSSSLNILQLNPAACIQKDILEKDDPNAFGTTIDRNITTGRVFRHGPLIDLRRMLKKNAERRRRIRLSRNPENVQAVIPFESHAALQKAS